MQRRHSLLEGQRLRKTPDSLRLDSLRLGSLSLVSLLATSALLGACRERPRGTGGTRVGTASHVPSKTKELKLTKIPTREESAARYESAHPKPRPRPRPSGHIGTVTKYDKLSTSWHLGELYDLGPAAPATATAKGAVFITRDNRMLISRREEGGDGFHALDTNETNFAKYGRGPAVSKTHAYWASQEGKLLRAHLGTGEVQVLYSHARPHTRTTVVTEKERDIVSFVAEIDRVPLAFVWAEKLDGRGAVAQISPEGSTASSVTIVPGARPRVVVLAGRSGMSPLHVRRIRSTEKRIELEPDEVVWIGPGSHSLTEIFALDRPKGELVAFLPTAKDFADFGLAELHIPSKRGQIEEPQWKIYPNGLDPAPVATAHLCGSDYLLYGRPTEQQPRSPQELHLAKIKGGTPGDGEIVARSRAFNNVSLASTESGAIAVWTADRRTWGMLLGCPRDS